MRKTKKLTTRQWKLYNFLKENYEEGRYISKDEICNGLPEYYSINLKETRKCRSIESDVRTINFDDTIQKIIVSNKYGYKIGNEEECKKYIEKRFSRELKNLKLDWLLANKVGMNNQMRLQFANERDYIETFMPGDKNED